MITIGLDPHRDTHTLVALDPNGKPVGDLVVTNDDPGRERLWDWAQGFPQRRWAIEGAGNAFIAAWAAWLLRQGDTVTAISPNLTSQYRSRRGRKKTDHVDAENVARALLANPGLPAYRPHPVQAQLKVLSRTRERLARQRKANRMALTHLAPDSPAYPALTTAIAGLEEALAAIEEAIVEIIDRLAPDLLDVCGVGVKLAGTILAEVGSLGRFANRDAFASYCGVAPVARASGGNARVQVNRGGNRRLNWALHLMASTRLRCDGGRSKAFVERKMSEGKTKREALRALKTYLARELYQTLCRLRPYHIPELA